VCYAEIFVHLRVRVRRRAAASRVCGLIEWQALVHLELAIAYGCNRPAEPLHLNDKQTTTHMKSPPAGRGSVVKVDVGRNGLLLSAGGARGSTRRFRSRELRQAAGPYDIRPSSYRSPCVRGGVILPLGWSGLNVSLD
jgi:hypothetical protein